MRMHGKPLPGPNVEVVAIPRGDNPALIFTCRAVLDYAPFDSLVKMPDKPVMTSPAGEVSDLPDDAPLSAAYKRQLEDYFQKRRDWMFVTSISSTPGLSWEQVNLGKPDTWRYWEPELINGGISQFERNRIIAGVLTANGNDDDKIREAKKLFLSGASPATPLTTSQAAEAIST